MRIGRKKILSMEISFLYFTDMMIKGKKMEKKKIDNYTPGYSNPDPFGIGRWYEFTTPEDIEAFEKREKERFSSPNGDPKEPYSMGIMGGVAFGASKRDPKETEDESDESDESDYYGFEVYTIFNRMSD